jgi:aminoglycoside phosphotransferase (APT) family kinase protein
MDYLDQPAGVRLDEQLPLDAVEAFIKDTLPGSSGPVRLHQFPSGASNRTYLVSCGENEMVLRCPPFGTKAATAHDMGREFRVLSALHGHWPYAPQPLAYTEDETIIGCPFYILERRRGIILRKELPAGLFMNASAVHRLFVRFVEVLHELHALDYRKIGLADLGKPAGYVQRQVLGWNKRYRSARTPDVPDCEAIMAWLEKNMPSETDRPGIIHNDFKFDNIVLDADSPLNIIGVLDWEMCTLGDPLMDLGCTLGYWVQKDDPVEMHQMRTMPTHVAGALGRREFVELYGQLSNLEMEHFDFYYCFGIFRLIVIIQQIYYRFYHGQTRNERCKRYAAGVPILARAARRVMERSDI